MTTNWYELRIKVPAEAVDLVGAALAELGCGGVTIEERVLDTFIPPDPNEPLQGDYELRAYFPADMPAEGLCQTVFDALQQLAAGVPGWTPGRPELLPVGNEDWAEGWKQHFSAVRIGPRLVVKPSWEDFAAAADDVVVELDPGMAFGTGTHGTTRLCLEAVAASYEQEVPPRRVLDVGTGSGILAIAAAALGAERVLACDIDPDACTVARENAEHNSVADRIEITVAPLEELEDGFDLVLANILAEENVRLAAELVRRVAPGGALVLSGILREKADMVATAFAAYPLTPPVISYSEDWACLVFHRR